MSRLEGIRESGIGTKGKLSRYNATLHQKRIQNQIKRKRVWVERVNKILCEGLEENTIVGSQGNKNLTDSLWAIPLDAYPTLIRAIQGLVYKARAGQLDLDIFGDEYPK